MSIFKIRNTRDRKRESASNTHTHTNTYTTTLQNRWNLTAYWTGAPGRPPLRTPYSRPITAIARWFRSRCTIPVACCLVGQRRAVGHLASYAQLKTTQHRTFSKAHKRAFPSGTLTYTHTQHSHATRNGRFTTLFTETWSSIALTLDTQAHTYTHASICRMYIHFVYECLRMWHPHTVERTHNINKNDDNNGNCSLLICSRVVLAVTAILWLTTAVCSSSFSTIAEHVKRTDGQLTHTHARTHATTPDGVRDENVGLLMVHLVRSVYALSLCSTGCLRVCLWSFLRAALFVALREGDKLRSVERKRIVWTNENNRQHCHKVTMSYLLSTNCNCLTDN